MAIAKVILNGEVLMDVTDTTALAPDVMDEKYFYRADGVKTLGTGTGGTDGDELGYGDTVNLIGYGLVGELVIDSYIYGYADYMMVAEDEDEEVEENGI